MALNFKSAFWPTRATVVFCLAIAQIGAAGPAATTSPAQVTAAFAGNPAYKLALVQLAKGTYNQQCRNPMSPNPTVFDGAEMTLSDQGILHWRNRTLDLINLPANNFTAQKMHSTDGNGAAFNVDLRTPDAKLPYVLGISALQVTEGMVVAATLSGTKDGVEEHNACTSPSMPLTGDIKLWDTARQFMDLNQVGACFDMSSGATRNLPIYFGAQSLKVGDRTIERKDDFAQETISVADVGDGRGLTYSIVDSQLNRVSIQLTPDRKFANLSWMAADHKVWLNCRS